MIVCDHDTFLPDNNARPKRVVDPLTRCAETAAHKLAKERIVEKWRTSFTHQPADINIDDGRRRLLDERSKGELNLGLALRQLALLSVGAT